MKTRIVLTSILCAVLIGCTPGQITSNSEYVAGAQFATYVLGNHPEAKPQLDELFTADAVALVSGTLDPTEYGRLSAIIEPLLKSAGDAKPDNKSVFTRISNLIASGAAANSGTVNPYLGPIVTGVVNFQHGGQFSEKFNAGRRQITDPPVIATLARTTVSKHP